MSEIKKNSVATEMAAPEKKKIKEPLVYVGPTITGVASHGMVFNNGISDTLKLAIEKEPAFKGLLVPLEGLSVALLELQYKTGATWALCNKVADYKA